MSPAFKSTIVPLSEVPFDEALSNEFAAVRDGRDAIVLVVDDERLVADTLTLIFRRAGFNVLTAYDALGALEIASAIAPDILVSDVDMPAMNGVDLAITLLRMLPECRVLLFSGHATFADLALARAAGHEFPLLPKPVHPAVMLENVTKCLRDGWAAPRARVLEILPRPELRQTA